MSDIDKMEFIHFKESPTEYLGKNGFGKAKGLCVEVHKVEDQFSHVRLTPINSKGFTASGCFIEFPYTELIKISEAMTKDAFKIIISQLGREVLPLLLTTGNEVVTQLVSDILKAE